MALRSMALNPHGAEIAVDEQSLELMSPSSAYFAVCMFIRVTQAGAVTRISSRVGADFRLATANKEEEVAKQPDVCTCQAARSETDAA